MAALAVANSADAGSVRVEWTNQISAGGAEVDTFRNSHCSREGLKHDNCGTVRTALLYRTC
jgi:hypothetical protein